MSFDEFPRKFSGNWELVEQLAGSLQCVSGNGANSGEKLLCPGGGDGNEYADEEGLYQFPAARLKLTNG